MPYKDPIEQKKAQHKHYLQNKIKYKISCTKSRPKRRATRALWIQELKSNMSCKECGEDRIPCLDFHHRNRKDKNFTISTKIYQISKKKILAEIKKCDVLCRNCHAYLHWLEWRKK
jgi:hypothetical protein